MQQGVDRGILILGANGQVGSALYRLFPKLSSGFSCTALGREQADLSRPGGLAQVLGHFKPSVVINAAAFTQVDLAETEENLARVINAEAPGTIARWCAENAALYVGFSTDYVFSGDGTRPRRETDTVGPLSAYGRSKLAGEKAVLDAGGSSLIFRSSWIYDSHGKNFMNTILKLAAEREEIRVISDQIGAPTCATDLASGVARAIKDPAQHKGIYHLCSQGEASWYGFARKIVEISRGLGADLKVKRIVQIPSSDYASPAQRPLNSRLDCSKVSETFGITLPNWEDSLRICLKERLKLPL